MPLPIRNVHIKFHIPFQDLSAVDSNGGMNEIGSRFAVPKPELDDLDEGTGNCAERGSEGPEYHIACHSSSFHFSVSPAGGSRTIGRTRVHA